LAWFCVLDRSWRGYAASNSRRQRASGDLTAFTNCPGKIRTDGDKNTTVILDPGAGVMTVLDHGKKNVHEDHQGRPRCFGETTRRHDGAGSAGNASADGRPDGWRRRCRRDGAHGTVVHGGGKELQDLPDDGNGTCGFGDVPGPRFSAIDISAADRATLQAAAAWSKDLTDSFAKTPIGSIGDSIPFKGGLIPLRSTTIAANGTRNTSEFAGVSTAEVTADTFCLIPADYKEQKAGHGPRSRRTAVACRGRTLGR
jgi:hypothetical protein